MQIASRPDEGTTVSLWLPVAPDPVFDRAGSERCRVGVRERDAVAFCWSTMIRLCSWRPRTCCANSGTNRSRSRPLRRRWRFCGPESGRTWRSSTTRCPKCPAWPWRSWLREVYPDCRCVLATGYSDREKRGGSLPRLEQALHSGGAGSPDRIACAEPRRQSRAEKRVQISFASSRPALHGRRPAQGLA